MARAANSEAGVRRELADVCRWLHARDLIGAVEGNVSCRLGKGRLLITPSGMNKAMLNPGDLVLIDEKGRRLRGRGRASTELPMHLAVYSARPEVQAVVHAHPLTAVALTVAGLPPPNDLVPEAVLLLGTIALTPFAAQGSDELAQAITPYLAGHDVLLLSRHGALVLGRSLQEAFARTEVLERVSRVAFLARMLGRCEPLPPGAIEKVLVAAGRSRH